MTTPVEASHHPGPPGILWAPSLANPYAVDPTGFAAWHRHWGVWVRLDPSEAFGVHPPVDGILLAPESPTEGTPNLATEVEHLKQQIAQLMQGPRTA